MMKITWADNGNKEVLRKPENYNQKKIAETSDVHTVEYEPGEYKTYSRRIYARGQFKLFV